MTYPYLGTTPRFYSQYLAGNGKAFWGIPGGTYIMTAVPGSGADLAGAAAIPPNGRPVGGAVRAGDPAMACRHPGRHTGDSGANHGERDRLGDRRLVGYAASYVRGSAHRLRHLLR